jgi:hypothetical protein
MGQIDLSPNEPARNPNVGNPWYCVPSRFAIVAT